MAEKSIVWRVVGRFCTMSFIVWRKPISSMRSASSSTSTCRLEHSKPYVLIHVLQQPTGRAHEDVHVVNANLLLLHTLAANDQTGAQVVVDADRAQHVEDLQSKLTGGRDHYAANAIGSTYKERGQ